MVVVIGLLGQGQSTKDATSGVTPEPGKKSQIRGSMVETRGFESPHLHHFGIYVL